MIALRWRCPTCHSEVLQLVRYVVGWFYVSLQPPGGHGGSCAPQLDLIGVFEVVGR